MLTVVRKKLSRRISDFDNVKWRIETRPPTTITAWTGPKHRCFKPEILVLIIALGFICVMTCVVLYSMYTCSNQRVEYDNKYSTTKQPHSTTMKALASSAPATSKQNIVDKKTTTPTNMILSIENLTGNSSIISSFNNKDKTSPWTTRFTLISEVFSTEELSQNENTEVSIRSTRITETVESSTMRRTSEKLIPNDLFYERGPFTFKDAEQACRANGAIVAHKEVAEDAYKHGFQCCDKGWLSNLHVAILARECKRMKDGVKISRLREPQKSVGGVYCYRKTKDDIYPMLTCPPSSGPGPKVNFWFTSDPIDAYEFYKILASDTGQRLLSSFASVYLCCNVLTVAAANNQPKVNRGKSMELTRFIVDLYKRLFGNQAKVFGEVKIEYGAMKMLKNNATKRDSLTKILSSDIQESKLDGVILNYHPIEDITTDHAMLYNEFIHQLYQQLHHRNIYINAIVSSRGIMKYYKIFNNGTTEKFLTTEDTYYGRNITSNQINIENLIQDMSSSRVEVGIGLMQESYTGSDINYSWSHETLKKFLSWLNEKNVTSIHIFPAKWNNVNNIDQLFFNLLKEYLGN